MFIARLVGVVVLALATSAAGATPPSRSPVELARLPSAVIAVAGADGAALAVTARGDVWRLGPQKRRVGKVECLRDVDCELVGVAPAGPRFVWVGHACGNNCYWNVRVTPGGHLEELSVGPGGEGRVLTAVAGNARTVAWGWLSRDTPCGSDALAAAPGDAYELYVGGGGVSVALRGRKGPALATEGVPRALAVAGTRVAALVRPDRAVILSAPTWHPDGSAVTLSARFPGRARQLYSVGVDRGLRRLTDEAEAVDGQPAWSPDGRELAFTRTLCEEVGPFRSARVDLYVLRDGPASLLAFGAGSPAWSRDGRLAYVRGIDEIWIHDLASGTAAHVGRGHDPSWSPDGRLAYHREGRIYVLADDGSERRVGPRFSYRPAWSPDGTQIAFAHDDGKRTRVWLMSPDGSGLRAVTPTRHSVTSRPAWSPDGLRIAYVAEATLYVSEGGSTSRLLYTPPPATKPRVEVVDALTSGRLTRFETPDAQALALSDRFVAVLAGSRLRAHSPTTGELLAEVAVPAGARSLSADRRRVVFAAGRGIYLLDAETRRVRRIATARARPVGLAIDGRRVIWAEGRRVLAVTVP